MKKVLVAVMAVAAMTAVQAMAADLAGEKLDSGLGTMVYGESLDSGLGTMVYGETLDSGLGELTVLDMQRYMGRTEQIQTANSQQ